MKSPRETTTYILTENLSEEAAEPGMAASSAMDSVAATALRSVLSRVQQATERASRCADQIRVVAVSKTKPVSLLRQVYDCGHRCFGENYVQELVEKAPQSNKVKPLLSGVPNLAMVETVDDEKIANLLNKAIESIGRKPLKVFVQVNTSGEESKSGIDPSGCVELARHVHLGCPNLEFCGLMTIGMPDYTSTPENFKTMANCRTEVCKALGIPEEQCELSMGMSGDFEPAVHLFLFIKGKSFADRLRHDPDEAEAEENLHRADMVLLEAKKTTSQYQKEADKRNSGMENCEEAMEKAESILVAQKRLTAMWELRAR
ncbi:Protein of unknown function DUF1068 [Dillenia turbinata]|uniref:Pyridoxal phosphate homeostasis protein n=1 Tax=Dillenia turbinata TaxID=194707 RepID=A0AAN8UYJ6_9MAGN